MYSGLSCLYSPGLIIGPSGSFLCASCSVALNLHIIGFIKKGRKTFYNILIDKNEIINLLITYKGSFLDSLVDRVIEMWEIK